MNSQFQDNPLIYWCEPLTAVIANPWKYQKLTPEISKWLIEHSVVQKGMVLIFPDTQTVFLFSLIWS